MLQEIFNEFVALRQVGRSQAWANLEDKLMGNAPVLILAGLLSPKDIISMAAEIENFRKMEQGSGRPIEDVLADWLNADDTKKTEVTH